MSAIIPKQETILANLRTQLLGIDGTASYNNAILNVYRRNMDIGTDIQEHMCPCLTIEPQETYFTSMTGEQMTAGNTISGIADGLIVNIRGYVFTATDTDDGGTLQQDMIKLAADVIMAIYSDITLSGAALSTTLLNQSDYFDYKKRLGVFNLQISIKYDFYPALNP